MPPESIDAHTEATKIAQPDFDCVFHMIWEDWPEYWAHCRYHKDDNHGEGPISEKKFVSRFKACKSFTRDVSQYSHHSCCEQTSDAVGGLGIENANESYTTIDAKPDLLENFAFARMRFEVGQVEEDVFDERAVYDVLTGVVATLQAENVPWTVSQREFFDARGG